jgi:HEAT repeat protein
LQDADERVRREAARARGRVGSAAESALPALVAARHDASPGVREAAETAVSRLTTASRP